MRESANVSQLPKIILSFNPILIFPLPLQTSLHIMKSISTLIPLLAFTLIATASPIPEENGVATTEGTDGTDLVDYQYCNKYYNVNCYGWYFGSRGYGSDEIKRDVGKSK